jgi:hypothetical protein
MKSFCGLLRHVVYAGKPGLDRVTSGQFAITLAKATDVTLNSKNWVHFLKRDLQIEQAMVILRASSAPRKGCPFPGCAGTTVLINDGKRW